MSSCLEMSVKLCLALYPQLALCSHSLSDPGPQGWAILPQGGTAPRAPQV